MAPSFCKETSAIAFRGNVAHCLFSSSIVSSITFFDVVNTKGLAFSSCSACASKSAAMKLGFAVSSAIIATSEGPATISIPTSPKTMDLAAATYSFPGPTILSTGSMPAIPYARVAIA